MAEKLTVAVRGGNSLLALRVCDALDAGGCAIVSANDADATVPDAIVLVDAFSDSEFNTAPDRYISDIGGTVTIVVVSPFSAQRGEAWMQAGASDCVGADEPDLADLPAVVRSAIRRSTNPTRDQGATAALAAMLDHTSAAMGWVDSSLRYRAVSPALAELDGLPLAGYAGAALANRSPWARPAILTILQNVISQGQPAVNVDLRWQTGSSATPDRACVAGFFPLANRAGAIIVLLPSTVASDRTMPIDTRLASVVNPIGVATARIDQAGRFVNADAPFQQLVGYSQQELAGLSLRDLIHPRELRADVDLFAQFQGGSPAYEAEQRWVKNGGQTVSVKWALHAGSGPSEPAIVVAIDHSPLQAAEKLALQLTLDTESALAAKDRFLAVLSHELRTPLTPVLATVLSIENDPSLPESFRDSFELIRRNVELEARLIDDLLDLTRLAKGTLQLNLEPVNLHKILQQTIELCQHDAATKAVHLESQLNAHRHYMLADRARLKQVFWNLLRNAIKFTPSGGNVTVKTADFAAEKIQIIVSDTGIGIEPETVRRIFSAFEQEEQTLAREFGGLGLGLSISKALIDLHGGTLTIDSLGKHRGTTVSALLKAAEAPAATDPTVETGEKRGRILVVEDHEDTLRAMTRLLKHSGFDVATRRTVSEAVEAVRDGQYDLLISDIGLPDGSGIDLIRLLRSGGSDIQAIALSGFGMEEDVRRSKEAGFTEHFTKPVDFERLKRAIEAGLEKEPRKSAIPK